MSMFAEFSDRNKGPRNPVDGLCIRHAHVGDIATIAAISAARSGGDPAEFTAAIERFMHRQSALSDSMMLVAEVDGAIIGFGRCMNFRPPDDVANAAPAGWYLMGIVVEPEFRRRGIGRELTRQRLDWIAERASTAYYFANELNRASIEMHTALGFVELTRDFWMPGVDFNGGNGVLFVKELVASNNP